VIWSSCAEHTASKRELGSSGPLTMGPTGCPATSSRNCHHSQRNNPEGYSSHPPYGGSLKSRTFKIKYKRVTRINFVDCWTLTTEGVRYSETSRTTYQSTRRHIRCVHLKPHVCLFSTVKTACLATDFHRPVRRQNDFLA
jgi:hypothetical protein